MSETPAFWPGSMPAAGSLLTWEPSDGKPTTAPALPAAMSVAPTPTSAARLRIRALTGTS